MRFLPTLILALLACAPVSASDPASPSDATERPRTIPSLQEWTAADGRFELTGKARILCSEGDHDVLQRDMEQFQADLRTATKLELKTAKGKPEKGDILFALSKIKHDSKEAYALEIGDHVTVTANTTHGAFYGMQSLLQIFQQGLETGKGSALDYPVLRERGMMIDCGRKYFEIEYIEDLIRKLAWKKSNFIHLHFTEWNGFRLVSETYPGLAADKAYSKKDIRRIQDFAARYYVTVVPEIDLPAHSTAITDFNPDLGFKSPSMRHAKWQGEKANAQDKAWTMDVTRPEVREWIRKLLDEWIPLFDGPYFHIGGDEWQYDAEKEKCPELMAAMEAKGYKYPNDIFVEWINEANKQVKSYGKTTQIWNWWRFCPSKTKQNQSSIQPDKDIVINIWNRPRQEAILADGYDAIITSETGKEALYVTPFDGTKWKIGKYGVFNSKKIYEEWKPIISKQVRGYKVCLWTNEAEDKADEWFEQFYEMPIAVFAERSWGGPTESTFGDFEGKFEAVGKTLGSPR